MKEPKLEKVLRAKFGTEVPTLEIVTGENVFPIYSDATWASIRYKDSSGNLCTCNMVYEHSAPPQISDGHNSIEMDFIESRKYQTMIVKIDGEEISPDKMVRFSFYASADIGPVIVSFAPGWKADARPLVMVLGGKNKSAPILRHFGIVMLYDIYGC